MSTGELTAILVLGLLPGIVIPIRAIQIAKGKFVGEFPNQGALNKALIFYMLLVPGWLYIIFTTYEVGSNACSDEACAYKIALIFPVTIFFLVSEALVHIGRRGI